MNLLWKTQTLVVEVVPTILYSQEAIRGDPDHMELSKLSSKELNMKN